MAKLHHPVTGANADAPDSAVPQYLRAGWVDATEWAAAQASGGEDVKQDGPGGGGLPAGQYDAGGLLNVARTVARNDTGQAEPVVPAQRDQEN